MLSSSGILQLLAAVAFCTLWRLAPFRPPNVEPVLATLMPFAKKQGAFVSGLIALLSIVVFDLLTSGLTQWTLVTALTYTVIGLAAPLMLRPGRGIAWYALYAILATIFYDAITGVVAGAMLFGMPWSEGFAGQIPFTVNHLIGNVILSLALSPLIEWMLLKTSAIDPAAHRAEASQSFR